MNRVNSRLELLLSDLIDALCIVVCVGVAMALLAAVGGWWL